MVNALERFVENGITDEGLIACLKEHRLGTQYVAKTRAACEKIIIKSEKRLYGAELQQAKNWSRQQVVNGVEFVNKKAYEYFGKGQLLQHIINEEKRKEI